MKYSKAIIPFLILSLFIIGFLIHFANITRKIEKENSNLKKNITLFKEQININQIEFSLYNSYDYLLKMQKIYFTDKDIQNFDNRISFNSLEINKLEDIHKVGIK